MNHNGKNVKIGKVRKANVDQCIFNVWVVEAILKITSSSIIAVRLTTTIIYAS